MRLKTCFALVLLALAPLCLFLPVFLSGKAIYGFDTISLGLPFYAEIQHNLAAHQWPLWMPDILGGMPGVAACNVLFVYPTDLLCGLLGLPLKLQLGLDAAVHVALAGIGMFLFLRGLNRSLGASLLGAVFFAFSGSEVSKLFGGHYNFLEGIPWLPWVFWAVHKACRGGSRLAWGVCGLFFSLQILAGAAQLFTYTLVAVAAFALGQVWSQGAAGSRPAPSARASTLGVLKGLALALGLTVLLAAPQLWLTAQYLPLSARGGYSEAQFLQGSISLSEAVTWLVPGFYGWQTPTYHGAMQNCFTSEYFGLLPWALAAAALSALWRKKALVPWMTWLALAAFFFSQGRWTPFYALFHRLPLIAGFRIWFRILFLLTFAVCTLAAFGWDSLISVSDRAAARRGLIWFFCAALLTAALAWVLAADATDADQSWLSHYIADPQKRLETLVALARDSAKMTLLLLPVLAALLLFAAKSRNVGLALALLLAFHGLDQKQVFDRFVHLDSGIQVGRPHFAGAPPAKAGVEPWRIYDDDDSFPNNDIFLGYENMAGLDSMPMLGAQRIKDAFGKRWRDWANLFNVRYIFVHTQAGSLVPGDQVAIYENPDAYPRAWLVSRTLHAATDEQACRALADPGFDPRREAVLAQDPGLSGLPVHGGVRWLERSPQDSSLEVSLDRDALLVLSNAWYPSWRARIDAMESPVLKVDGGLQAVFLKAGKHHVQIYFDPGLFNASLAACALGLLALAVLVWVEFKHTRLRRFLEPDDRSRIGQ